MTTPATCCPKCGAALINDSGEYRSFACISHDGPVGFVQSDRCKIEQQRQEIGFVKKVASDRLDAILEKDRKIAMLLQECERLKLEIESLEYRI